MLAYFFLPAIAFLFVHPFKRNRFVRFHSVQCLLGCGILLVVHLVLAVYGKFEPVFALPLYGLLLLADVTLWLLLLAKAFQHVVFKLPYIGDLAERWTNPRNEASKKREFLERLSKTTARDTRLR